MPWCNVNKIFFRTRSILLFQLYTLWSSICFNLKKIELHLQINWLPCSHIKWNLTLYLIHTERNISHFILMTNMVFFSCCSKKSTASLSHLQQLISPKQCDYHQFGNIRALLWLGLSFCNKKIGVVHHHMDQFWKGERNNPQR